MGSARAKAAAGGRHFLPSLQVRRFIAAAMVLYHHIHDATTRGRIAGIGALPEFPPVPWASGVDIFFVVSGFVMYYLTSADERGGVASAGQFMQQRLTRIVPLYWAFTTLTILTMLVIPDRVVHDSLDLGHVLASYFFVPAMRPDGQLVPVLALGWTLNYEMLFYLLFAAALFFDKRYRMYVLAGLFAILLAVGLSVDPYEDVILGYWGRPLILEFVFGIVVAHLYMSGFRVGRLLSLLGFFGGFVLLAVGNAYGLNAFSERWIYWGLPAALIVASLVCGPEFRPGFVTSALVLGGNASYALYLSHLFTLRAVGIAWEKAGLEGAVGFAVVAFVASVAVSIGVFLLFERPVLSLLRRRARLRPGPGGIAGRVASSPSSGGG